MKKWKENQSYYLRRAFIFLFAVAIVLGVIGLYQYYESRIEKPWQMVTAIAFGTFKLFFFAPTLSPDADYSPFYEVAKWLAPLLSSALVLSWLNVFLLHLKNLLAYRFSTKMVIIGYQKETLVLLRKIKALTKKKRVYVYHDTAIKAQDKEEVEKLGYPFATIDFTKAPYLEKISKIAEASINNCETIIFMSDDLKNYESFAHLIPLLKPKQRIRVVVRMKSYALRDMLEKMISRLRENQPSLSLVDVTFYDEDQLYVDRIMNNEEDIQSHIATQKTGVWEMKAPHFVVVGYDSFVKSFLLRVANDFTISLNEPIRVTMMGRGFKREIDELLADYPELDQALDIRDVNVNPAGRDFLQALQELKHITRFLIVDEDPMMALEIIERIQRVFPRPAIYFKNNTSVSFAPLFDKSGGDIRAFGTLKEIMDPRYIINQELDIKARNFNDYYNKTAEEFGNPPGAPWDQISEVKKSSSRNSAAHSRVKQEILRHYFQWDDERIKKWLTERKEELKEMVEVSSGESLKVGLTAYLETYEIINFLAQLEHLRWCRFYYSLGFTYGETKDEMRKTHPCLVEDWDRIIGDLFFQCHPIYDVIAVLSTF